MPQVVLRFLEIMQDPDFDYQQLVRRVPLAGPVAGYALALVRASRPGSAEAPEFVNRWLAYGASVRAAQYLVLGGKARALTRGRVHVAYEDIQALARPVLRHRLLRNFHAESEQVGVESIIDDRYRNMRDTILITNDRPDEFVKQAGESIASRVKECGQVIVLKGKDYRDDRMRSTAG